MGTGGVYGIPYLLVGVVCDGLSFPPFITCEVEDCPDRRRSFIRVGLQRVPCLLAVFLTGVFLAVFRPLVKQLKPFFLKVAKLVR